MKLKYVNIARVRRIRPPEDAKRTVSATMINRRQALEETPPPTTHHSQTSIIWSRRPHTDSCSTDRIRQRLLSSGNGAAMTAQELGPYYGPKPIEYEEPWTRFHSNTFIPSDQMAPGEVLMVRPSKVLMPHVALLLDWSLRGHHPHLLLL